MRSGLEREERTEERMANAGKQMGASNVSLPRETRKQASVIISPPVMP